MGSMLTASEGNSTMSAVRPCRSLFRCAKRPLPSSHGVRLASYQSRWVAVGHGGSYESQGTPTKHKTKTQNGLYRAHMESVSPPTKTKKKPTNTKTQTKPKKHHQNKQ